MNKLILIDGYNLLFRGYFASRSSKNPNLKIMRRSDGVAVDGLYVFIKMILKLISNISFSHIAVAFDTGKATFRKQIYSEYKSNRPPCPDDLVKQFSLVREFIDVFNIQRIEIEGFEADDIIATYTNKAKQNGLDVVIATTDKDLMQLVDENVTIYNGMLHKIFDVEEVKKKWGVFPKHILDYLTLVGDTSDNIPGAKNIGPIRAIKLIEKYGDINNILNNIENIEDKTIKNSLKESIDNIKLSKKLITLEDNVLTDIVIDDLKYKNYNNRSLYNFLSRQGFKSIINDLHLSEQDWLI